MHLVGSNASAIAHVLCARVVFRVVLLVIFPQGQVRDLCLRRFPRPCDLEGHASLGSDA